MKYIIVFLFSFILVYLFYFITVIMPKEKLNKFAKSNQVMYFIKRYKINVNKIDMKILIKKISMINSFIVSTAFTFTFLTDNFLIGMLIGLGVLIPLMLICYYLLGMAYKRGVN